MKKDLFNIDLNNSADEFSILSPQSTIHKSSSECKKINIDNSEQKLTILRALDKIDRLGWQGVRQLLGEGRKEFKM